MDAGKMGKERAKAGGRWGGVGWMGVADGVILKG